LRRFFFILTLLFPSLSFAQRCGFDFSEGILLHPYDVKDPAKTIDGLVILVSTDSLTISDPPQWKTGMIDTGISLIMCYQNDTNYVEYHEHYDWSGFEYHSHWKGDHNREHFTIRSAKDNYLGVSGYDWRKNSHYITIIDTMESRPGGMYEIKRVQMTPAIVFNYCSVYSSHRDLIETPIALTRFIRRWKSVPKITDERHQYNPPPPPRIHKNNSIVKRFAYSKDSILLQLKQMNPLQYESDGSPVDFPVGLHSVIFDTTESYILPIPDSLLHGDKYRWLYRWDMPLWNNIHLVYFERSSAIKDTAGRSAVVATFDKNYKRLHTLWVGTGNNDFKKYLAQYKLKDGGTEYAELRFHKPKETDLERYHFEVQMGIPPQPDNFQNIKTTFHIPKQFWSIDKKGAFHLDSTEIRDFEHMH